MKKLLAILLAFTLAVGLLPMTAYAEPVNDLSMCVLSFGEGWDDFVVESIDEPVYLADIPVQVKDRDGNEIDPEKYDLTISIYKGWDEENQSPDILWLTDCFRLTDYDVYAARGYGWFSVSAVAKDGSGLTGSTRPQNVNVRHLYSFNDYCVTVKFDEDYQVDNNPWADQNYYVIPLNRISDPEVWNRAGELVDPEYYTVTYYRRNMEELDYDDYRDPEYLAQRYPEVDPLDDIPSEPGCYFAVTEAKAVPYYGKNYVDIDIVEAESDHDLGKGYEVLIDGEGWKVFTVDSLDDTLSQDDLHVTVVDQDGDEIPQDAYELVVGTSEWNEELKKDVFTELSEPYSLPVDQEEFPGFGNYAVYAVAKDGSGYSGETEQRYFMIWHKYSFNYFGANADFGKEYKANGEMTWHDRYVIPSDRIEPPVIHGIDWDDEINPEFYEITYYYRHDEVLPPYDPENPGGVDYDETARYPENDPNERLDSLPTEVGTYFARIEGKEPYYGVSYVDFDIVQPSLNDCQLRFRGKEEWAEDYHLNSKDETLTLDQLDITVVDKEGNAVSPDAYTLQIGIEVDYDDDLHQPVIRWTEEPFGVSDNPRTPDAGWCMYTVKAVASENGGYSGETRLFEFMLRDKHTLSRDSAYIDFGEEYQKNVFRSWHYNFIIPQDGFHAPDVYNCLGEKLDPSEYTLTYFERFDEYDDFDLLYSEDAPLDEMPTTPGSYFVRLDGNDPYYGTTYADFDIVEAPESYALVLGDDQRYYDGDTIYMKPNSEIMVRFDITYGPEDQLAGWISDQLKDAGFIIEEPVDIQDGYAYCKIGSGDLAPGTKAALDYHWYHFFDVYYDGSFHWDEAEPYMFASVNVEVVAEDYDYLLGDADGDGEISVIDVTMIQRRLAELFVAVGDDMLIHGDADGDGVLSIADTAAIRRYLAQMSNPFEVGKPIKNV